MSYASLIADLDGNLNPLATKLGQADDLMRKFVRRDYTAVIRLDTNQFGKDVGRVMRFMEKIGKTPAIAKVDVVVAGVPLAEANLNKMGTAARKLAADTTKAEAAEAKLTAAQEANSAVAQKAIDDMKAQAAAETERAAGFQRMLDETKDLDAATQHATKTFAEGAAEERKYWDSVKDTTDAKKKSAAAINEEEKELKRLDAMIGQVRANTVGWDKDMDKQATFLNKLAIEARAASEALSETEIANQKTISKVGSRVAQFTAGIIAYRVFSEVTGTIEKAIKAGIAFDAEMETTGIALQHMMGGSRQAADALIDDLHRFAQETPEGFDKWLPDAQKLAAAHVAVKEIVPDLKAFGDASTALGRGHEGVDLLTQAFVKMGAQGKLNFRQVQTFATMNVDVIGALVGAYQGILPKGTQAARLAMEDMVKHGMIPAHEAGLAITYWIEHNPLKAGLMKQESNTFSASVQHATDSLNILMGRGLKPVFDELKLVLSKEAELGKSSAASEWADRAATAFSDFIRGAKEAKRIDDQLIESLTGLKDIKLTALVAEINTLLTPFHALIVAINLVLDGVDKLKAIYSSISGGVPYVHLSDDQVGARNRPGAGPSDILGHRNRPMQQPSWMDMVQGPPLPGESGLNFGHNNTLPSNAKGRREPGVGGVPSYYQLMEAHLGEATAKTTGKMYECGESITWFMHKVGLAGATASALAAKMNIRPDDRGHYPVGTVLHLAAGHGPGFSTRHYGMAGRINPDGTQEFLESTARSRGAMNAAGYHISGSRTVEQISGRIIGSGRPGGAGADWKGDIALHAEELRSQKQQEAAAKRHTAALAKLDREHREFETAEGQLIRQMQKNVAIGIRANALEDKKWAAQIKHDDAMTDRMDARRNKIEEESRQRMRQFNREAFIDEHSGLSTQRAGEYAGISRTYATERNRLLAAGEDPQAASDAAREQAMAETRELLAKWDLEDRLEKKRRDLLEVTKEENAEYKLSALFLQNGNKVLVRRAKDMSDLGKALAGVSKEEREFAKATVDSGKAQQALIDKFVTADLRADRLFNDSFGIKDRNDKMAADEYARHYGNAMSSVAERAAILGAPEKGTKGRLNRSMLEMQFRLQKETWGKNNDQHFTQEDIDNILNKEAWLNDLAEIDAANMRAAENLKGIFKSSLDDAYQHGWKTFFGDVLSGLNNMLEQAASDYLSSKLVSLLTHQNVGGDSGANWGAAGGLLGSLFKHNNFGVGDATNIASLGGGGYTMQNSINPGFSPSFAPDSASLVAHHFASGSVNIHVSGAGDPKAVAEAVVKRLNATGVQSSQGTNVRRAKQVLAG